MTPERVVCMSLCVLSGHGWQAWCTWDCDQGWKLLTQDWTFRDRNALQSTSCAAALQPGLPWESESADEGRIVGYTMSQRGVKKADLHFHKALRKSMIICRNQNSPTLIHFLRKLVKCSGFLIEIWILKSLIYFGWNYYCCSFYLDKSLRFKFWLIHITGICWYYLLSDLPVLYFDEYFGLICGHYLAFLKTKTSTRYSFYFFKVYDWEPLISWRSPNERPWLMTCRCVGAQWWFVWEMCQSGKEDQTYL